ncbi:ATP-dependent helicase HrpA [Microbacteriaceae bacterium MWH-Ta3]|nr:ATP-dependent helicase HrpA [Microbacteriaceae bacterium MWH-Ta3]
MGTNADYTLVYPDDLPVSQQREAIMAAIQDNPVVIVAGETGSGKTTQLPKMCLELGRKAIAHTQPRRIAARAVAERLAEELQVPLGGVVGYTVRFTDETSKATRVQVMTDGVLLAAIHRDPTLAKYDTIIIDEAHERSLTIDVLLGFAKRLTATRPDLRVIITSATIDPDSFARHFATPAGEPAPVILVSGRTYPVEVRYRTLSPDAADPHAPAEAIDQVEGLLRAIDELKAEPPGDVLVFLSGESEIRDAADALNGRNERGLEVLPLYGRLAGHEQHRVFETPPPGTVRRVILSTNVAETSITVPGIRYVVDSGTARISRYSHRAKVLRLPIEPISQASAQQRAGRAGRVAAGIAIRLYSEADFEARPAFTDPEVLRTNLASVILTMVTLGLGDVTTFPFLTPPDSRGIKDGLDLLVELGAVTRTDDTVRATRIGHQLSRLPVDPRFGRMIIESMKQGTSREVIAIVAGLTIIDPREVPDNAKEKALEKHARFVDPTSDFLGLLKLWDYLTENRRDLSSSAFRRLCRDEYLHYLRVREWMDLNRQLVSSVKNLGHSVNEHPSSPNPHGVHRSILAGLLSRIGLLDEQVKPQRGPGGKPLNKQQGAREYLGARGARFVIAPNSSLAKKTPTAVMAAELTETRRLFARWVATIDPAWVEPLAGHLVARSYSEPRWDARHGSAVADEKVMLYGVPIVPKRRIQYARINRTHARELFIRHAMVDGDWPSTTADALYAFVRVAADTRATVEGLETRSRGRDVRWDDDIAFAFFDSVLPDTITSVREFEGWWRTERRTNPALLNLTVQAFGASAEAESDSADFPAVWRQGDAHLAVSYSFNPGADDDGMTVHVPAALYAHLTADGFDWLVPGLRVDLVTALLKSLPKSIRVSVVPAKDWAAKLVAAMPEAAEHSGTGITQFLALEIRRQAGILVSASDFDWDKVPPHLRARFALTDAAGRPMRVSRDFATLESAPAVDSPSNPRGADRRTSPRNSVASTHTSAASPVPGSPAAATTSVPPRAAAAPAASFAERHDLTEWPGDIPDTVDITFGASRVTGYPGLRDTGADASLVVFGTRAERDATHRRGAARLLLLTTKSPGDYVVNSLSTTEKLALAASPYSSVKAMTADALLLLCREAIAGSSMMTDADFAAARDRVNDGIVDRLFAIVSQMSVICRLTGEIDSAIRAGQSMALIPHFTHVRSHVAGLVHPGFLSELTVATLHRYPVYLRGVLYRLEKLRESPARDRQSMTEFDKADDAFTKAGGAVPVPPLLPAHLVTARWALEELRISLFAQQLGAAGPVSVQRITKMVAPPEG